ncbi:hypothetical protein E8E13_008961 [Curvularia kusanoi]|uniref:Uncharacterized protein n=1 Tax=Curvularia kusanoi TaxID=90978 RepID=A0A9P4TMI3_CURKU|nr:hypothetical protein E8E13_008961 [Curvularia kusanoi]
MLHNSDQSMNDNQAGGTQDPYDNYDFCWYSCMLENSAKLLEEAQHENTAESERFSREIQAEIIEYKQFVDQFTREVENKASGAPPVPSAQATSDEGASTGPIEVNETESLEAVVGDAFAAQPDWSSSSEKDELWFS